MSAVYTDDRDLKLIALVRHHQHIYDKNSNFFKDKTAVENSWRMIANTMETSEDDCQRRWCVLRNRYAKERREQNKLEPNRKPWTLMQAMSFIDAHVKRRRSFRALSENMEDLMTNRHNQLSIKDRLKNATSVQWEEIIIDEDEETEEDVKNIIQQHHSDLSNTSSYINEEEISITPVSKPPEIKPGPKIVSCSTVEKVFNEIEIINLHKEENNKNSNGIENIDLKENNISQTTEDSNMHFCLSLNESLRKIPTRFLTKVKIEILQVIDKYEHAV